MNLSSRLRALLRRDDRGAALPMVLLVFFLGVALIAVFLINIVGSSHVTVASKNTVQAQAAAEAGIADALARSVDPASPICSLATATIAGTSPTYSVKVSFGGPSGWSTACPTTTSQMRIVSTGTSSGTKQTIERIHALTVTPAVSFDYDTIIYSGNNWTFNGNGTFGSGVSGLPADIMITTGDFVCGGGATIQGSVYVKNGNADLSKSNCVISGNLEVSGNLLRDKGSSRVLGNAVVGGKVTLSGGTLPVIGGSLTHGGALSVASGSPASWVGGAINQTPVTIAPAPPWRTLNYDRFIAAGFAVLPWEGACDVKYSTAHPMPAKIAAITRPTIVDARACPTLTLKTDITVKLGDDTVLLAPKMNLEAFTFGSTDATERNLYVVSSNNAASCPTTRIDIEVSGVNFTDKRVAGLLYGECRVTINNWGGGFWRGSIYARNISNVPLLTYVPVADPDRVGGGGTTVPGGTKIEPTPLSVRNISAAP
ncbi:MULTISPECIES: hypothetical protein [unclassified Leucobacter]|uniref:hypothetical protein n=1 Tax=unclassified Leucobacter TaxID=2621730 RepID=UPI00165DF3D0|nr:MULTISPECIES: hypothetical protein [unclassified Leucobacter]MBC9925922.1 hypothetical protein [Leucobacter sp. cx-169]